MSQNSYECFVLSSFFTVSRASEELQWESADLEIPLPRGMELEDSSRSEICLSVTWIFLPELFAFA